MIRWRFVPCEKCKAKPGHENIVEELLLTTQEAQAEFNEVKGTCVEPEPEKQCRFDRIGNCATCNLDAGKAKISFIEMKFIDCTDGLKVKGEMLLEKALCAACFVSITTQGYRMNESGQLASLMDSVNAALGVGKIILPGAGRVQ